MGFNPKGPNETRKENMRAFKKPNLSNGWKCPICNKNDEKEVVLLGIDGTRNDNIMEAQQVHLDCLNPVIYQSQRIIAQPF